MRWSSPISSGARTSRTVAVSEASLSTLTSLPRHVRGRAPARRVDPLALAEPLAEGQPVGQDGGQVLTQLGRVGPGAPGHLDREDLDRHAVFAGRRWPPGRPCR